MANIVQPIKKEESGGLGGLFSGIGTVAGGVLGYIYGGGPAGAAKGASLGGGIGGTLGNAVAPPKIEQSQAPNVGGPQSQGGGGAIARRLLESPSMPMQPPQMQAQAANPEYEALRRRLTLG